MTVCEALFDAALYWPPHTVCPALVQELTFPHTQHVSVVQKMFQILHMHTNILINCFMDFMRAKPSIVVALFTTTVVLCIYTHFDESILSVQQGLRDGVCLLPFGKKLIL